MIDPDREIVESVGGKEAEEAPSPQEINAITIPRAANTE